MYLAWAPLKIIWVKALHGKYRALSCFIMHVVQVHLAQGSLAQMKHEDNRAHV